MWQLFHFVNDYLCTRDTSPARKVQVWKLKYICDSCTPNKAYLALSRSVSRTRNPYPLKSESLHIWRSDRLVAPLDARAIHPKDLQLAVNICWSSIEFTGKHDIPNPNTVKANHQKCSNLSEMWVLSLILTWQQWSRESTLETSAVLVFGPWKPKSQLLWCRHKVWSLGPLHLASLVTSCDPRWGFCFREKTHWTYEDA